MALNIKFVLRLEYLTVKVHPSALINQRKILVKVKGSSKIAETTKHSNEILLNPQCYLIFDPLLESKLLSSLLDDEPYLQAISERLDTTLAGAGNYRAVARYYGLHHYTISSVLEKYDKGPTTALIVRLAATHTELTVQEFAAVVRQKAKRKDVAELLEAYDSGKQLEDV